MLRTVNVDYIKKLWTLDLVVQQGSLKRAAQKAKVSPSAVSQAITSLERSVGKPLLVRRRGSAVPTPEAVSLLNSVRPAFDVFEKLNGATTQSEIPKMSWLDFGTYESLAIDLLPALVARLHSLMPECRLTFRISRTGNLLTMVRKGELCTALITETECERFYCKKVGEDRLGFYVSHRHPIQRLGWGALEKYGVGVLSPGKEGYPRYMTKFLRQIGSTKPFLKSDSFESLRACAAGGLLVAALPGRVARRNQDLVEIFPGDGPDESLGRHDLLLISQSSCDREEVDFLAAEIGRIIV